METNKCNVFLGEYDDNCILLYLEYDCDLNVINLIFYSLRVKIEIKKMKYY